MVDGMYFTGFHVVVDDDGEGFRNEALYNFCFIIILSFRGIQIYSFFSGKSWMVSHILTSNFNVILPKSTTESV